MIKKQILCCSAFFSVLLLAKFAKFENEQESMESPQHHIHFVSSIETLEKEDLSTQRLASLHFAQVYLPHDQLILNKMMRHLRDYTYQNKGSQKLYDKAIKSLPEIASLLVSMGIPEDFKYIPLIESGLSKNTTSHKGASGYWQFIPATARAYGLRVDDEIDERQDLIKSTNAAGKYLKALHAEFGDWALVAAAYNTGDGNLKRVIKRQNENDYFRLKLNRETGNYVYKLIAAKEVIERPELYGYQNHKQESDQTLFAWETNGLNDRFL